MNFTSIIVFLFFLTSLRILYFSLISHVEKNSTLDSTRTHAYVARPIEILLENQNPRAHQEAKGKQQITYLYTYFCVHRIFSTSSPSTLHEHIQRLFAF